MPVLRLLFTDSSIHVVTTETPGRVLRVLGPGDDLAGIPYEELREHGAGFITFCDLPREPRKPMAQSGRPRRRRRYPRLRYGILHRTGPGTLDRQGDARPHDDGEPGG